jgi:hypothetical protein
MSSCSKFSSIPVCAWQNSKNNKKKEPNKRVSFSCTGWAQFPFFWLLQINALRYEVDVFSGTNLHFNLIAIFREDWTFDEFFFLPAPLQCDNFSHKIDFENIG